MHVTTDSEKKSSHFFNKKLLSLVVPLMLTSPLLSAQASADDFVLEEIIVTSTKRPVSVQDTAASVSVISADTLDNLSALDLQAVEQITPGLTLDTVEARTQSVSLRGITYDPESAASPAVDVYWNEIGAELRDVFTQMFDVEKVEVLRGPQGTLQGRTSPGGAIHVYSRRPSLTETEGYIQSTLGGNGLSNTQFGTSIPIIEDKLGIRLAGIYDQNGINGIENVTTGNDEFSRTEGGRLTISWNPTADLDITLISEYRERAQSALEDLAGSRPGSPSLDKYDRRALANDDGSYEVRNRHTGLIIEWETEDFTLTSVTGYQEHQHEDITDLDFSNLVPGQSQIRAVDIDNDILSQELRVSGDLSGTWQYILGGYYQKREGNTHVEQELHANLNHTSMRIFVPGDTDSYGLFVHNHVKVTDKAIVEVGVRWQKNDQFAGTDLLVGRNPFGIFSFPVGVPGVGGLPMPEGFLLQNLIPLDKQSKTSYATTGTIKLSYDLNNDLMVYGSIDSSYRIGGLTISSDPLPASDLIYEEENSLSYELGFKSTLLDGKAQFNGALYLQDFDGFINRALNIFPDTNGDGLPDDRPVGGLTFNADTEVLGAEVEFAARLTENWTVNASASYNDSKYQDGETAPCNDFSQFDGTVAVARCEVGGQRSGTAPNLTASVHTEYLMPLTTGEAFIRALYKYTDSRVDENVSVDNTAEAYGVANLYVGYRNEAQGWEIMSWAKNLFDDRAESTIYASLGTGYSRVSVIPERSFGVTARYNFSM